MALAKAVLVAVAGGRLVCGFIAWAASDPSLAVAPNVAALRASVAAEEARRPLACADDGPAADPEAGPAVVAALEDCDDHP